MGSFDSVFVVGKFAEILFCISGSSPLFIAHRCLFSLNYVINILCISRGEVTLIIMVNTRQE